LFRSFLLAYEIWESILPHPLCLKQAVLHWVKTTLLIVKKIFVLDCMYDLDI